MRRAGDALRLSLTLAGLLLAVPAARGETAGNATQLRDLLLAGQPPAQVAPAKAERGCGPAGCSIDVDGLSIQRTRGRLVDGAGRRIALQQHGPQAGRGLPTIDWELIEGFSVRRAGQRWGTCLEFAHTGVGKSGSYQRWSSVVLVPWPSAGGPGRVAHRFVGYWAGCDSLAEGPREGEVGLPTVQPVSVGAAELQIVRHLCSARGCTETSDPRSVAPLPANASNDGGALLIERR